MRDEGRALTRRLLRAAITAPTARDEQKLVGPSDLGDACDFCLGLKLTRMYPQYRPEGYNPDLLHQNFGLKAWLGTGAHHQMEVGLAQQMEETEDWLLAIEHKVPIYHLPGYGMIKGHIDLVVAHRSGYLAVVDHKTTDRAKLRSYKVSGVPEPYVFQTNLYGYGVSQVMGVEPHDVGINFIPRDSNNIEDTWQCFAPYNPGVAEMALVRLEEVWEKVQAGDVMKLEQHSECWTCGRRY